MRAPAHRMLGIVILCTSVLARNQFFLNEGPIPQFLTYKLFVETAGQLLIWNMTIRHTKLMKIFWFPVQLMSYKPFLQ